MIKLIKNLTRKQIIIIVSSLVVLTGIITTTIILLNKDEEEIKKCLVEFDTNGGSFINSEKITCGNTIKKPDTKPEKTGFEFTNWTYNNQEFDFNTKINENIILVANYNKTTDEEIITVTFNSDGGSEVKPIELMKGTTITEPVSPIKVGYVFDGWYLNENMFDFTGVINESITLTAKWIDISTTPNSAKPSGNTGKCTVSKIDSLSSNKINPTYTGSIYSLLSLNISYAGDCRIEFTSTNPNILSITKAGTLTAHNIGNANIEIRIFNSNSQLVRFHSWGLAVTIPATKEPTTPTTPSQSDNDDKKYIFVEEADYEYTCTKSGYGLLDGKCYKLATREEKYGCDGKEVNGKCYYDYVAESAKYSCDPGDEYVSYHNDRSTFCRRKKVEIYEPYSDGTCSAWDNPNVKLNADGKCEYTYHSWRDEDSYDAYVDITCPSNTIKMKDENGKTFCGLEKSYGTFYGSCPNTSNYWRSSGTTCYDMNTETQPTKVYKCGMNAVDGKPLILKDNKCYRYE